MPSTCWRQTTGSPSPSTVIRRGCEGRGRLIAVAGGLAHTAGSLVAMVLAIGIGVAVATGLSSLSNLIVGLSFLAVGAWKFASAVRARDPEESTAGASQGVKWLVFTATSSPELTIFQIFLAASVYGLGTAILTIAAFAVGTIASMVAVTLAGVGGMARFLKAPGREKQIDYAIALILLSLGMFVVAGG